MATTDVPARRGDKLEVIDIEGRWHFKIKGSEPPEFRTIHVEKNVVVRILPDGPEWMLISSVPNLMLRSGDEGKGVPGSFQHTFIPGVCFEIV